MSQLIKLNNVICVNSSCSIQLKDQIEFRFSKQFDLDKDLQELRLACNTMSKKIEFERLQKMLSNRYHILMDLVYSKSNIDKYESSILEEKFSTTEVILQWVDSADEIISNRLNELNYFAD